MYQSWLSQARTTPLSLSITDIEEMPVPSGGVASLLRMVVGMSQRWQHLHLDIGYSVAEFLFPIEGPFPLLEKLTIGVHQSHLPIFFCDAPKLRDVVINIYNPQIQVPWHQLTTFESNDIDIHHCLEIIRNSPSLLDATFEIRCNPVTLPTLIVEHIHLERLVLGVSLSQDLIERSIPLPVLACARTPTLRNLALDFIEWLDEDYIIDISPFLSFLSRSSVQLHTLTLCTVPARMCSIIECLEATPSLQNLGITPADRFADIDAICLKLTGERNFLPNLKSFHLAFSSLPDSLPVEPPVVMTPATVVRMLSWRWGSGEVTSLRSFRLAYWHEMPVGETVRSHSEFRRLKEEGMILYIGARDATDAFL
ncbi:hypothetical protein C8R46DRAFT_1119321 [Mycena filopes]|nr:hypothetical protein C8R46DRAFT_1119321 [Mycena filopes]